MASLYSLLPPTVNKIEEFQDITNTEQLVMGNADYITELFMMQVNPDNASVTIPFINKKGGIQEYEEALNIVPNGYSNDRKQLVQWFFKNKVRYSLDYVLYVLRNVYGLDVEMYFGTTTDDYWVLYIDADLTKLQELNLARAIDRMIPMNIMPTVVGGTIPINRGLATQLEANTSGWQYVLDGTYSFSKNKRFMDATDNSVLVAYADQPLTDTDLTNIAWFFANNVTFTINNGDTPGSTNNATASGKTVTYTYTGIPTTHTPITNFELSYGSNKFVDYEVDIDYTVPLTENIKVRFSATTDNVIDDDEVTFAMHTALGTLTMKYDLDGVEQTATMTDEMYDWYVSGVQPGTVSNVRIYSGSDLLDTLQVNYVIPTGSTSTLTYKLGYNEN